VATANTPSANPAPDQAGAATAPVDGNAAANLDRASDPSAAARQQLPGLSTQLAAEISGPIAVRLSGLPPVEHEEFRLRASVAAAGSSAPNPTAPAGHRSNPVAPGGSGPMAGVDAAGASSGGAGSSGTSAGNTMPPAVLLDPDSAPLVFALSELTAPERRITWWYPEVVVGPG
jgi:hypothetical protein